MVQKLLVAMGTQIASLLCGLNNDENSCYFSTQIWPHMCSHAFFICGLPGQSVTLETKDMSLIFFLFFILRCLERWTP